MKLIDMIRAADEGRPNAFPDAKKTSFLNELENTIRSEVMAETPEREEHVWESQWRGTGITCPDSATLTIPGRLEARPGGAVAIAGLTVYAGNEGQDMTVLTAAVSDRETTLTFAEGTFPVTGTEPETAGTYITYDGANETMLAPDGWSKIYVSYLEARIDAANTEFDLYANSLQIFNEFFGDFCRWYARTYIDNLD